VTAPAPDLLVDDLSRLVGVESPSADPDRTRECGRVVADWVAERLPSAPAPDVLESGGVTHLRWRFGGPARVLLLGHLDTVWPAGTLARWPFAVVDGRATGPGCFDMKAGLVQSVHALAALAGQGADLAGVTVLVTADEELGSPTSAALVRDSARGAAAVLVTEPSAEGALKIARKGVSVYRYLVSGRAAHAGLEPERGCNAGIAAAHLVLAAAGLGAAELGTTVTPTLLQAGTTTNTVPAQAELAVDVRATSAVEQRRVDDALRALAPAVHGVRWRIEGGINRAPLEGASSAALFERSRLLAEELGLDALTGVAVGGGSDGNLTAGIGVPTLDGLGAVGGGAHAEGEWVDIAATQERTTLLAALVRDLLA